MEDEKISRRGILGYIIGTGFTALGLATLYPIVRYVTPTKAQGTGTQSVSAAKVGDIKPNEGLIFKFGDHPAILILKAGGQPDDASSYVAFTAVCTHLGCTVQYREDLKEIWCACHNGLYDLNGNVLSGPPPRPLTEYSVAIKGKDIFVSTQQS
jgi:cytochrome b6-f complex iron-sulfur subunit